MPAGVALHLALTLASGAAVTGLVRGGLSFAERCAISVVVGLIGGTGLSLAMAMAYGIGVLTAEAGPALLGAVAVAAVLAGCPNPWFVWREAWNTMRDSPPRVLMALTAVATLFFTAIFRRALVTTDDGLMAGYQTVWADWSLHATTASSFAAGHNLPAVDPLFSGTPLRYPFLPDFHAAMLLVLGWGMGPALSVPGLMLCIAISVLVISLGHRLTGSFLAGGMALTVCVLGGGLGFIGYAQDACAFTLTRTSVSATTLAGTPAGDTCTWRGFRQQPLAVIGDVARGLGPTLQAQPRAYDALLAPDSEKPIDNQQWYTPLMAWWLPQRSFLFGFGIALAVLTLLLAAGTLDEGHPGASPERREWPRYVVAGALVGSLPLIHIHTLIVLGLVLPWFLVRRRWREWLAFAATAGFLAVPRLLQLASGPKGTAASGNQFPRIEAGWMSMALAPQPGRDGEAAAKLLSVGSMLHGCADFVSAILHPMFWWFWISNTGILLPVMVIAAVAWAWRGNGRRKGVDAAIARITDLFGAPLLRFCVPFLLVFVVANIVVFQSWDWDNTKLFAYWQFAGALLVSGAAVRWFRGGAGPAAAAAVTMISLVLTGTLVILRLLPWTPPETAFSVSGPYSMADADQIALARQITSGTPTRAVFLTAGGVNDPALVLAGRTAFLGFTGWVSSYGNDFSSRSDAQRAMYAGCAAGGAEERCASIALMRANHIDYAEILDSQPVGGLPAPGRAWWDSQHFPVVARSAHAVVYDVRHA